MSAFLFLIVIILSAVFASQLSSLKARFMRLQPYLDGMQARIIELERALAAAKQTDNAAPEPAEDQAYHDRWRAAAAAASASPRVVSEPVAPPEPEPKPEIVPIAEVEPPHEEVEKTAPEPESVPTAEPVAEIAPEPEPEAEPEPEPEPEAITEPEPVAQQAEPPVSAWTRPPLPKREPAPAREPRFTVPKITLSFEELVGSKLPIWVGGISLILAGFFLVSYSYQKGYFGPAVQCIAAALFGLILLAASEAGKRIKKIAEDPRVAQSLAGAGIAVLYATVYMTRYIHGLISPSEAVVMMACVTVAALGLSLRHGPPTAFMGLLGGFVAPFFAAPSGNLTPLLVYLGLLIAGLFALSIHRGWRWLAVLAVGGGFFWSTGILALGMAGIGATLGGFIVLIALGAAILFPRSGLGDARARMVPMIAGFVQLAYFANHLDFGLTGWAMYGMLSAAALFLGWKDRALMPVTIPALGLVLVLLAGAFGRGSDLAPWVAIAATALFALPGHILARRPQTDGYWTALALGGGVGPLLIAFATHGPGIALSDSGWALLFAAAALPHALLSWRARGEGRETGTPDWALFGGATAAGAMIQFALWKATSLEWNAAACLAAALAVAFWAKHVRDGALFQASLGFGTVSAFLWLGQMLQHGEVAKAVFADGIAPSAPLMAALLIAPSLLVAGLAWLHRDRLADMPLRWIAYGLALSVPLALVPLDWHGVAAFGFAALTALWARIRDDRFGWAASIAAMIVGLVFWLQSLVTHHDVIEAVFANGGVPAFANLLSLLIAPALLLGSLAWCHRGRVSQDPLRWLALAASMCLGLALVPALWHPSIALGFAAALSVFGRVRSNGFAHQASLAAFVIGLLYWLSQQVAHPELAQAIVGDAAMPDAILLTALFAVPLVLLLITAWGQQGRASDTVLRTLALAMALGLGLALVPALWHPAMGFAFAAALSVWSRVRSDTFTYLAGVACFAVGSLFWTWNVALHPELANAIFGAGAMPIVPVLLALLAVPAVLLGLMAWGHHGKNTDQPLRWIVLGLVTALVLAIMPFAWQPAALAVMAALALFGSDRLPLPRFGAEALLAATGLYMVEPLVPFAKIMAGSFAGVRLHYQHLAPIADMAQMLALPTFVLALVAWGRRSLMTGWLGNAVFALVGLSATAMLYGLAKQPLAIASDAQFIALGFIERAAITQSLLAIALGLLWRGSARVRPFAWAVLGLGLLRFGWFDLLTLNPVLVQQNVGALPVLNAATLHYGLTALWFAIAAMLTKRDRVSLIFKAGSLALTMVAVAVTVRQFFHHAFLDRWTVMAGENYGYSAAFLVLAIVWLWRGIVGQARWLRLVGFVLLTAVTCKAFLYDARVLQGLFRVFSFMGLGAALMVIGWAYPRFVARNQAEEAKEPLSQ